MKVKFGIKGQFGWGDEKLAEWELFIPKHVQVLKGTFDKEYKDREINLEYIKV